MSRNLPRCAALALLWVALTTPAGCMYQQPMYQPYGSPYGQPMYPAQPGYGAPGTIVVPPTNTSPYPLGGSGSTFEEDGLRSDDFNRDSGSSTGNDSRFFSDDSAGGVPRPKDPGGTSNDQFNRELTTP